MGEAERIEIKDRIAALEAGNAALHGRCTELAEQVGILNRMLDAAENLIDAQANMVSVLRAEYRGKTDCGRAVPP